MYRQTRLLGPVVQCNVGKRGWMAGIGGCPNVGGVCIGCTMPGFPDKFMPFLDEPPGAKLSSAAIAVYGRTIRALRQFTQASSQQAATPLLPAAELTAGRPRAQSPLPLEYDLLFPYSQLSHLDAPVRSVEAPYPTVGRGMPTRVPLRKGQVLDAEEKRTTQSGPEETPNACEDPPPQVGVGRIPAPPSPSCGGRMDPTILLAIVATATAVSGGAYLFACARGRGRARDGAVYHFRCPGCGRRLRYQSRQVGRKGKCSHCGKEITFPTVALSID